MTLLRLSQSYSHTLNTGGHFEPTPSLHKKHSVHGSILLLDYRDYTLHLYHFVTDGVDMKGQSSNETKLYAGNVYTCIARLTFSSFKLD